MLHVYGFPTADTEHYISIQRRANAAIAKEFPSSILKLFIGTYIAFTLRITYIHYIQMHTHMHTHRRSIAYSHRPAHSHIRTHAHPLFYFRAHSFYLRSVPSFISFACCEWCGASSQSRGFLFLPSTREIFPSFSKMEEGVRSECAPVCLYYNTRYYNIFWQRKP